MICEKLSESVKLLQMSMNNLASIRDVMVLTVGIKINCLVRQSMMTNIMAELSDRGSFLMKFMDIEFQGLSGIRSCFRSP